MNRDDFHQQQEHKDLLRFLTCGSVDDGKSTLIGRLLYDSHMILEDQLAAIRRDSKIHGTTDDDFDPALLTDGLKAEREQGITIDVAYRYFATAKRKFIIADTPGHEQYTRNMATGASNCNLAIVLIDARLGVTTQTRRHSFIASLMGIKHVVVAVNKMDLVNRSESVYEQIRDTFLDAAARLDFADLHFIPMSALYGENVVHPSSNMPWYQGPTLLHHLENVTIATDRNLVDLRYPVQCVIRPNPDYRGFAGTVASGVMRVGDEVMCLPSRNRSRIKSISSHQTELKEAWPPMSICVTLEDEIDVSRGDMLVHPNNQPTVDTECEAMLVWMDTEPAQVGRNYLIKHTTRWVPATLTAIRYQIDVNTMRKAGADPLQMNDIGRAHLTLHRPIAFDAAARNPQTGHFILVDRVTHATAAAGLILDRHMQRPPENQAVTRNIVRESTLISRPEREQRLGQRGTTLWLTGLSGSGKSTIAKELEVALSEQGIHSYILDGDNIRHGLNKDLGFSAEERQENIRRIAAVAQLFNDAGLIVITAFISPYRVDRDRAREVIGTDHFVEVHISTPLDVCEQRDPKNLYKRARAGEIPQFTGISDPYEEPLSPELVLNTADHSVHECVDLLVAELRRRGCILDKNVDPS